MPLRSRYLFCLTFSIFLLLSLNFTILRSLRNTLAVVELGSGAHVIPFFELCGAMPGAFLMTYGLAWMMRRFSIVLVFIWTLAVFLGFFLIFAILIHPFLSQLKQGTMFGEVIVHTVSMLFYVMAELWKPALILILFCGLVNQYVPVSEAKKLYAPLMLGGSVGAMIAGPVISLCLSETIWGWFPLSPVHWIHGFNLMTFLMIFIGIVTGCLYCHLWRLLTQHAPNPCKQTEVDTQPFLLKESLFACMQSRPLRLLSWIVIADYIAYSLGEVIFLDFLKLQFPLAADYCHYMGTLALWSGILTFISSLFIAPFILQHCPWVVASLVTPICLLITEGLFFVFLQGKSLSISWFGWTEATWVVTVTLLGSIQYCVCRGIKYTLFDSSKEIAFVLMPEVQRMQGKLIVDGLCARLGRGSSSVLSLSLIAMSGSVLASSFLTGIIAIGFALSWITSTCRLGQLLDVRPVTNPDSLNPILTKPLPEG